MEYRLNDMADTPPPDRPTPAITRRSTLAICGALAGGLAGVDWNGDAAQCRDCGTDRSDFLWMGSAWQAEILRDNLFALARRHDLALGCTVSASGAPTPEADLKPHLEAAAGLGLDVWLNVGLMKHVSVPQFVDDASTRREYLSWLQSVARVYGDVFDDGRFILWQEAPVMGRWSEDGKWTRPSLDHFLEYGPYVFEAQLRAIRDANPTLNIGIFPHFPYVVDSKSPEVFPTVVDGIHGRGVRPDFAFVDFYRSWYEKDAGPARADATVRNLVSNARDAVDGAPVYYLGQSHTINPNHTPSRESIRSNVRASLDADGIGWYRRTGYAPTRTGFDPFIPNAEDPNFTANPTTTLTFARDRLQFSCLSSSATRPSFDADASVDLWLVGDWEFYDHRVWAETAAGEFDFLGDVAGYVDGDYPHVGDGVGVTVFRALDRERYLANDCLNLRLGSRSDGRLRAAYVMPCDPDAYVTEPDAASLVTNDAPLQQVSLGATVQPMQLSAGDRSQVTVTVDEDGGSLDRLRAPEYVDALDHLEVFEARPSVDPDALFDLWVDRRAADGQRPIPSVRDEDGTPRSPVDESVVTVRSDSVVVSYGLDRERFLDGDTLQVVADEGTPPTAVYAMPYAGRSAFRTPARVATLLTAQPSEVKLYSLAYVAST